MSYEFDALYESTKALLAPLRQLFLSLTTESNKTYWLVATIVLPPIILGLAHYYQVSDADIADKKRKAKASSKKSN